MMQYTYTAAWAVVGGISLREESPEIKLADSGKTRFILTRNPDIILARVDESSAVGRLMLKGLIGQQGAADFSVDLATEIEKIKAERKKKIGGQVVLLFEAQGEIEATLKDPIREHDTFIVTFDAVEKGKVRQLHQADIEAMKAAVAFESATPSLFVDLTDETHLLTDTGKVVHNISFSMSAEVSISTLLSEEAANRISARYAALNLTNDLDSVVRLFSQMAEYGTDRLKVFLSGWAALEILIAQSFKHYEEAFLSPFTKAEQPTLRERFLERVKGVMKDKYRLTDKFIAVTAVLFPETADDEVQQDYKKFCQLKDLRDSILHGEPFLEKQLPVHELTVLLRKYVFARIATHSKVLNAGVPVSGAPVR